MDYGYRTMKPEWKKDYAMEVKFDDKGCVVTLWSDDKYNFSSYSLTYEQLSEWKSSGLCSDDVAWTRSEFVRQILQEDDRSVLMPHSGPRKWRSAFSLQHYSLNIHRTLEQFGTAL